MGFAAHLNACIFYRIASEQDDDGDDVSWISSYCLVDDDDFWSTDNGTSPEYDDGWREGRGEGRPIDCLSERDNVSPNTRYRPSVTVTILSEVMGTTLFAYVIGNLVAIVLNLDPGERNRKMQVNYLNDYGRALQLLKPLRMQLPRHYNYRLKFKSVFAEDQLLADLPPHVRNPAMLFLHRGTLPFLPLFCQLEGQFLGALAIIMPKLRPSCYGLGDIVNGPDINAREWVFVLSGAITVTPVKPPADALGRSMSSLLLPDNGASLGIGLGGDVSGTAPEGRLENTDQPVERFKPGSYLGEATIHMPDSVPFTLLVECKCVVPFTNVLMLTPWSTCRASNSSS